MSLEDHNGGGCSIGKLISRHETGYCESLAILRFLLMHQACLVDLIEVRLQRQWCSQIRPTGVNPFRFSLADYGFWTLLHSDSTQEALQVFLPTPPGSSTDDGGNKGEWINANPKPNTFIVNIGEAWEVLSNGLYRAVSKPYKIWAQSSTHYHP